MSVQNGLTNFSSLRKKNEKRTYVRTCNKYVKNLLKLLNILGCLGSRQIETMLFEFMTLLVLKHPKLIMKR